MSKREGKKIKKEIDHLIGELQDIEKILQNAEQIFDVLDEQLKQDFAPQIIELLAEFKDFCYKIQSALEKYFKYEKENDLPIELKYRKIYKNIEQYLVVEFKEGR